MAYDKAKKLFNKCCKKKIDNKKKEEITKEEREKIDEEIKDIHSKCQQIKKK